jgi:iron complex outermembrane receptor protein
VNRDPNVLDFSASPQQRSLRLPVARAWAAGSLTLLAALAAGVANAQVAAPAPAASQATTDEVQTVTVTANRRAESSQKVSGVVQSTTGDQLRRDGITEVRQLQNAVPGLSIANQEGNTEIFIRGVGSANNTELGDPGSAPHLNGIYIPRPRGLGLMFYDLERVEVNKGPQGTLYGRNALGGTLNIITARARLGERSGYVQGELTDRSGGGFEGAFNIPLGEIAALRFSAYYKKRDYGFTNASTGDLAKGLNPAGLEENKAARLSATIEPTEKLRLQLVADYGTEGGTGYPGANIWGAVTASGLRPEQLDITRVVYRGLQGEMTNKLGGLQAKVNYDFGGFEAELSSSYRSVDFYQRNAASEGIDYPGRDLSAVQYDNFSGQYWQTKSKSYVNELRLFSNDKGPLQWSAGLFSFQEDQQVGFLALADRGYCCYSGTEFTMPDVRGRSTAVYVDGTYSLAKDWRVFGGLRHSEESKYRYGIGGNLALTLGAADFACCIATRVGTEGFVPNLLDRPIFDLSGVVSKEQIAQFLIDSIKTAGARDTLIDQIQAIAAGTNPNGTCFIRDDINNGWITACPTDQNGGFSYANLTIPSQQVGRSSAKYQDFRLGFEHDLAPNQMIYAKVSTGHKAGGFNDSFNGSTVPETFAPEKLLTYEVGTRNAFDLAGRRAILNLTAFHYDYSDQVFQDLTCINVDPTRDPPCTGYSLVNRNVGKSKISGLEAEFRVGLPARMNLEAYLTLLDTRVTKGVVADVRAIDYGQGGATPLISLVGNELPLASKVNLAARLQQSIGLAGGTFDWQALVNYRSDYYLTQFNEADVVFLDGTTRTALEAGFPDRQKGFVTVNLGAGFTKGPYRIEAFASNVTNEQASQKALVGASVNVRFLNDARSYGVRGIVRF